MAVLVGILVSLLVAFVVLLLAGAAAGPDTSDDERPGLWRAFRSGWAARRRPDDEDRAAAAAASAAPVDVSLAEFLRANVDEGDAYLQVEELSATLERAARRVPRVQVGRRGA